RMLTRRILTIAVLWFCLALPAISIQRFPPPEFETDHTIPTAKTPEARAQWLGVLDITVLITALSLASWLILKKRSRTMRYLGQSWCFSFYRWSSPCFLVGRSVRRSVRWV
ncbi:MAG: hypothetical protein ACYTFP_02960, partial [Planctomycetota bacterium]